MGTDVKSDRRPYRPDWKNGLKHAQAAPRCRARCRRSKLPCRAPAMRGKPVCRRHGGKGGGPKGAQRRLSHGTLYGGAKAEPRQFRMLIRELRHLIDSGE